MGQNISVFLSVLGPFILNRPAQIPLFDPVVGGIKTDPVACLIAQGPDDHRGVVLVPFNHTDGAVKVRFHKEGIVPQGSIGIVSHSMRFNIRLVNHIKSVLVAQLIPAGIIGIVTGANCIDIILFHQRNILQHHLLTDHMPLILIMLMPVHPFQGDSFSIDQQLAVFDFGGTESHLGREILQGISLPVFQCQYQGIKIRAFRPTIASLHSIRSRNVACDTHRSLPFQSRQLLPDQTCLLRRRIHQVAISSIRCILPPEVTNLHIKFKNPLGILLIQPALQK